MKKNRGNKLRLVSRYVSSDFRMRSKSWFHLVNCLRLPSVQFYFTFFFVFTFFINFAQALLIFSKSS